MASEEPITDVMADVIEEQGEVVGEFVRNLNSVKIRWALLGLAAGSAVGALAGFKLAYAKAEAKFEAIAQEEIQGMREHYQEKARALEAKAAKAPLEEIVRERGYSSDAGDEQPPMAVQPPDNVVQGVIDEHNAARERERRAIEETIAEEELAREDPELRNVFDDHGPLEDDHWDYQAELQQRSPLRPYVIHYDEVNESEAYSQMSLSYYEGDDVLARDDDSVVGKGREREELIGEANLNKFGHGSNDRNVVYIRNDRLEMVIEVVRNPAYYAQEVHGFDPPDDEIQHAERRRGKLRFDDE